MYSEKSVHGNSIGTVTVANVYRVNGDRLGDVVAALAVSAPTLLDADSVSSIKRALFGVPAMCSGALMFELELGRIPTRVAVSLGLSRAGSVWFADSSRWPSISSKLGLALEHSTAHDAMPWIEFDTDRFDLSDAPVSLYVGMHVHEDRTNDASALIARMSHDPIQTGSAVRRCLSALPPAVRRIYVGSMVERGVSGVRLSIESFDLSELLGYLETVFWRGETETVRSFLRKLSIASDRFCLQMDLNSSGVDRRIGIEVVPRHSSGSDSSEAVVALLSELATQGRCSAGELQHLATWPWRVPSGFARIVDAVLGECDQLTQSYSRILYHLKFVFGTSDEPTIKAYFGAFRAGAV